MTMPFFLDPRDTFPGSALITIGFFLTKEIEEYAISLAEKIAETEIVTYRLNHDTSRPYLRLYEVVVPETNLSPLISQLESIIPILPSSIIDWAGNEETHKSVIIWAHANPLIKEIQKAVIEIANPLREGYYKQKYASPVYYLEPLQQESLEKYGWPYVAQYQPYVVIAKAKQRFTQIQHLELDWPYKKMLCQNLFVARKLKPGNIDVLQDWEL